MQTPSIVIKYLALWSATQVPPQRACDFCFHVGGLEGLRSCMHPDVKRQPVEVARSEGGMCGPQASMLQLVESSHVGATAT